MVVSWFIEKGTEKISQGSGVLTGVLQPTAENIMQAGVGAGGVVGGTAAFLVGGGAEITGNVGQELGIGGDQLADFGLGLKEFGGGAAEGGFEMIFDAAGEYVSTESEVAGGLEFAAVNLGRIVLDWSEDDTYWESLSDEKLELLAQDDIGYTDTDSLWSLAYGSTVGAGGDSWETLVARGTIRADQALAFENIEGLWANMNEAQRRDWLNIWSDAAVFSAVSLGGFAAVGGVAGLRVLWAAGSLAKVAMISIAMALITAVQFGKFALNSSHILDDSLLDGDKDSDNKEEEGRSESEEEGEFVPGLEDEDEDWQLESDDEIEESPEPGFSPEDEERMASQYNEKLAAEAAAIAEQKEKEAQATRDAGAAVELYNPYVDSEVIW